MVAITDITDLYAIARKSLSLQLMIEHRDLLPWSAISEFQRLPEWFIHGMRDYVDWTNIVLCQNITDEFIQEHQSFINWEDVTASELLTDRLRNKYAKYFESDPTQLLSLHQLQEPPVAQGAENSENQYYYMGSATKSEKVVTSNEVVRIVLNLTT